MKKMVIILATLLLGVSTSHAVMVKLPDAAELIWRLSVHGYGDFAEKTAFVNQLANRQVDVSLVDAILDIEIYNYRKFFRPGRAGMLDQTKILWIILHDSPEGLKELQRTHPRLADL